MRIATSAPTRPPASAARKESWLVVLLCVAAGLRVFIFSAAFPFFNNVDEVAHFDLVLKYSHGNIPRGFEPLSLETGQYIARYATPEYLTHKERFADGKVPLPMWARPQEGLSARLEQNATSWQAITNPESSQAPLYYALAGLWLQLGRAIVPTGGYLLYWIRFLNVLLIGALTWLAFVAARMIFPERRFLRLGVPALLAFLPQDAFYSIQNDVLAPLCFGVAFIGLVRLLRDDDFGWRVALTTGLALAATGLVKVSSLPLLMAAAAATLFRCGQLAKVGTLRLALPSLGVLALSAALPLAALAIWNETHFGDLTGSAGKVAMLGWTHKPFLYWWLHPIFSLGGLWTFWRELTESFWRGEIVWFGQRLASKRVDFFYSLSSALLPGLALASLWPRFAGTTESQRPPLWLATWCCLASILFLAVLSIAFDFGNCVYPSREHPYFVSGRLLSGVLVPFALLYVLGVDRIFSRAKTDCFKWAALATVILIATISEILINRPVFFSQYNFFHL